MMTGGGSRRSSEGGFAGRHPWLPVRVIPPLAGRSAGQPYKRATRHRPPDKSDINRLQLKVLGGDAVQHTASELFAQ